jgi:hypothetical protein
MDEKLRKLAELELARKDPAQAAYVKIGEVSQRLSGEIANASDEVVAAVSAAAGEILDEVKKKPSDIEFTYDLTPEETEALRGPKGDPGEPGADADEEEIIDRVIPEVLKAVPTAEEVAALVTVPEPIPGAPGLPGRDGTQITPDEVVDKVNESSKKISADRLDLPKFETGGKMDEKVKFALGVLDKRTSFLLAKQVVKTVNGAEPDPNGNVTVSTGGDTSGLVPYTGATGDVDIGSYSFEGSGLRAHGSGGGNLQNQSGGNVLSFGQGGGVNATAYGGWNFNSMTPGSVPFFGAAGLLSQDNAGLYYDDSLNRLSIFSTTGTDVVTNGGFTSSSGWSFGSFALSGGKAVKSSNGTTPLSQSTATTQITREYRLRYTVSGWTAGTVTPSAGGFTCPAVSGDGVHECRFVATSTAALSFTPSNTSRLSIDDVSLVPMTGTNTRANLHTGGVNVDGGWGNGTPGTTRAFTFNNSDSYTWTDYRFGGLLRVAVGANSSGGIDTYFSGGNGAAWYSGNSGLTSNTLAAYLYSSGFVHYGFGSFGDKVHAGSTSAAHTTLHSARGLALGYEFKFESFTAGDMGTYFCDASTPTCTGTPSVTACSTYTGSGQATCESHLPCVWFAGNPCSAFNGDPSSCAGQSGCTVETASCSSFDEMSCSGYTGCSWTNNPQDCSGFDESACNATSGCSTNTDSCSNYSDGGGDGTACNGANGGSFCEYDSGSGACSGGSWFTSCSGTYDSYSCTGSYETGNCTGTYGAACSGTVACGGYSSSGTCAAETGCTWSTAMNVTLPAASGVLGRTVTFVNASSSGADVNILPTGSDSVGFGTTSYTLPSYKDKATFQAARDNRSCSGLSEGACAAQTGCSVTTSACSWDSGSSTCSGHASCTGIGDQGTCEGTTYYSGCSGTYDARIGWFLVGV